MKSRTQIPQPKAAKFAQSGGFAFLAIAIVIAASITLSSCAGYTSVAETGGGGQTGSSGAGILSPSSTSLSFGNVAVGSTANQTVSVTNTGTATVNITGASIAGAGFTMVGGSGATSVPVGQSASLQIQFAPASEGSASATLTVNSDASNAPLTVSLNGTGMEAIMSLSPASLNFSNVPVGQTSSQNVTITNNGNSNLTFTSATISGTGFTMSGLSPLPTIGAGQSATFSVQFTPTSTAGATGSVVFHDNAAASPQTLTLAGSAVATGSTLTPNPGSVNFGNVVVGTTSTPQTITLTNSGNAAITINQVTTTGTGYSASGLTAGQQIAAGGTANFSVSFAPAATGTVSGNVTIASTATNGSLSITLSGTGTQGDLIATPSSVAFGNLAVGLNASIGVTLKNTGTASISITGSSISGAAFTMSTLATQTLTPNQTASFNVTFTPTASGAATGTISVTNTGAGSPLNIALSGTGTQAQISANPSSVSFGTVAEGNSNSQPITLKNNGNATLTFSQISVTGTGFSQTGLSTSTTIAAGGSTTFDAVFTPSSANPVTGSITLTTNGTPSPLVINLSGTGSAATFLLRANPTSLSFGNVNDGSNSSLTTSISNNGNSNVTISGVTVTGAGFSANGISNGTILTPGQSATLTVTFAPTTAGTVSGASVSIASNATNSPATIALSGTGTHTVLLQWSPSPTSGVTYNVFRGTSKGGEGTTPINPSAISGTSYTDTNVSSGTNYFYTVEAVNSGGSSAASNEAEASVP